LAAITAARDLGVPWDGISDTLSKISIPPGRLEKIETNTDFEIYIDFAHTPDSLEKVLQLLKTKTKGRLISIFGCASERDVLKRPMMGEISTKLADVSIFTAEDPRYEDINKIIDEISQGVKDPDVIEVK